ncbi:FimV/HubP family polar landmark protein [Marinobacterium arenosum]|uniref:FimV/HubP family polar landmark protein n=1 Tax=Marinobacterium arenosum TaxID=2862496 RepID=UPI001C954ADE|nr:FimV/HubP family polar landmark protein [Marinobacterium arenosum]MBY4675147.1 hypothetical protein [Marinobacterium arenosum]
MLRKLAISLAVAGVLSAAEAHALGLGDITIKSALNEPLDAEIRLVQTKGLSPLQIQPRMADVDEFALAGISKSRFLSDVKFSVDLTPNGEGTIRMHSSVPVKEPFLNFLVEINWPNGRLVREYTVLLDPPVFDPTPARQAAQPVLPAVSSQAAALPSLRRPAASAPADNIRTRMKPASQIYVDVKDTLWALALKHRPSKDITPQQMMVALQKKNPDAFHRNNVNLLKAGVVLDLPSEEQIRALTPQQAVAEVARQTEAWKQRRGKSSKPAKAPVDVSRKDTGADGLPGGQAEQAQLKIVSPANPAADRKADGKVSDQGSDDQLKALTDRNQELEQQLSAALEDVDRIERDNSEMNERLDAVQQQLDTLQRLLELKDQQVAQLQAELAAAKAQIPPDPVPAAESPSLVDKLLSTPLYWGSALGGLLVMLGGGLFALLRRGRKEGGGEQPEQGKPLVQVPEELNADADKPEETESDESSAVEGEGPADEISDEQLEAMEDLDDLSDLDLDLDMDLELDPMDDELMDDVDASEETQAEAEQPAEDNLEDMEFDLGIEDDLDELQPEPSTSQSSAEAPADEGLDSILAEEGAVADELDSLLGEVKADKSEAAQEVDDDLDTSLDELLAADAADDAVEAAQAFDGTAADETGLEIDIADDDQDDEDDLLDGLDLDELLAENGLDAVEPADEVEDAAEVDAGSTLELAEADSLFDEILQQNSDEELAAETAEQAASPFKLELDGDTDDADSPVSDDELDALLDMAEQSSDAEQSSRAEQSDDGQPEELAGDELDALFQSAQASSSNSAAEESGVANEADLAGDELDALFASAQASSSNSAVEEAGAGDEADLAGDELDALFASAQASSSNSAAEETGAGNEADLAGDELDALFDSAKGADAGGASDEVQDDVDASLADDELDALFDSALKPDAATGSESTEIVEELSGDDLEALFDEVAGPVTEEAAAEESDGLNLHPDLAELLAEQPEPAASADEGEALDSVDFELPLEEVQQAAAVEAEVPESGLDEVEFSGGLDDMLAELDQADDDEPKEATAADLAEVELKEEELGGGLDDMLADLGQQVASKGGDDLASLERSQKAVDVEAELTASIAHDLEAELDDELDALLNGTDREIALDESDALEDLPGMEDDLNLLAGADEVETKLDLAKAYIEMGDQDGARDILNEVKAEGSDTQQKEADKLLAGMATA